MLILQSSRFLLKRRAVGTGAIGGRADFCHALEATTSEGESARHSVFFRQLFMMFDYQNPKITVSALFRVVIGKL
jgi:hypothetical protein